MKSSIGWPRSPSVPSVARRIEGARARRGRREGGDAVFAGGRGSHGPVCRPAGARFPARAFARRPPSRKYFAYPRRRSADRRQWRNWGEAPTRAWAITVKRASTPGAPRGRSSARRADAQAASRGPSDPSIGRALMSPRTSVHDVQAQEIDLGVAAVRKVRLGGLTWRSRRPRGRPGIANGACPSPSAPSRTARMAARMLGYRTAAQVSAHTR